MLCFENQGGLGYKEREMMVDPQLLFQLLGGRNWLGIKN